MSRRSERRASEVRASEGREGVLALQRALLAGAQSDGAPRTVTGPVAYRFGDEPDDVASVMIVSGGGGGGIIETSAYEAIERFRRGFDAKAAPSAR